MSPLLQIKALPGGQHTTLIEILLRTLLLLNRISNQWLNAPLTSRVKNSCGNCSSGVLSPKHMQTTRTLVSGTFLDSRSFFSEWIACSNGSTPDSTWCLKCFIFVRRSNILSMGFCSSLGKNTCERQEGNQLSLAGRNLCAQACKHPYCINFKTKTVGF